MGVHPPLRRMPGVVARTVSRRGMMCDDRCDLARVQPRPRKNNARCRSCATSVRLVRAFVGEWTNITKSLAGRPIHPRTFPCFRFRIGRGMTGMRRRRPTVLGVQRKRPTLTGVPARSDNRRGYTWPALFDQAPGQPRVNGRRREVAEKAVNVMASGNPRLMSPSCVPSPPNRRRTVLFLSCERS